MNKTYYDEKTNLEWLAWPDKDMTWDETKEWIESLGGGWRMPTVEEYETIYKEGLGIRNMPSELETTGWWGWTNKEESTWCAWGFGFDNGKEYLLPRYGSSNGRGFAVRSRDLFDNLKTWFRRMNA